MPRNPATKPKPQARNSKQVGVTMTPETVERLAAIRERLGLPSTSATIAYLAAEAALRLTNAR